MVDRLEAEVLFYNGCCSLAMEYMEFLGLAKELMQIGLVTVDLYSAC